MRTERKLSVWVKVFYYYFLLPFCCSFFLFVCLFVVVVVFFFFGGGGGPRGKILSAKAREVKKLIVN